MDSTDNNISNNQYNTNNTNPFSLDRRSSFHPINTINILRSNTQLFNNRYSSHQNSFSLMNRDEEEEEEEEEEEDEDKEEESELTYLIQSNINRNTNSLQQNNNINNNINNNREENNSVTSHSLLTSVVSSNDICLDSSFSDNITLLNGLNNHFNSNMNNNRQRRIRENNIENNSNNNNNNNNLHVINNIINGLNNPNQNSQIPQKRKKINKSHNNTNNNQKHQRINSAPIHLLNEFQEFKYSSQYVNLIKAFTFANGLILIRGEGRFDIESEEGTEICHKFLNQIELLMSSFGIKGENRDYREKFSKAYYYLFDKDKLCFLTEILDSAQETSPFLVVNGDEYSFSSEVLEKGNSLFNSFCSLIMTLTDIVKNIRDELFYNDVKKVKEELKISLIDFDKKWVDYEENYINELIEIEKKSRKIVIEGINIEKEITNYENKSKAHGKLLINDKKYNQLITKLVEILLKLNKTANVDGKGRSDLHSEILFKAEKVLITVSENQSKGMRNLAFKIKSSLYKLRLLLRKYSNNIEGIDPQLRNNKDLSKALYNFEIKWEQGKIYLLDSVKYNQLLSFSQIIEIICEKYSKYSIRELIENDDPSIFVSLPSILVLKAIYKEDKGICKEYILGLYDKNNESGKLFSEIKQIQKKIKKIINDSNKTYNLLEKLILFDNTKEQAAIEKEMKKYIDENMINSIKKGLTNLSMHLQRYKPAEWNTFFELAMDIKINKNDKNEMENTDKTLTDNNSQEEDITITNTSNNNEEESLPLPDDIYTDEIEDEI